MIGLIFPEVNWTLLGGFATKKKSIFILTKQSDAAKVNHHLRAGRRDLGASATQFQLQQNRTPAGEA